MYADIKIITPSNENTVFNCLEATLRLANDIRIETGNESKNVDNIFEAATAEYYTLYSLPSDSVTALNVNDINADTRTDRIVEAIKENTAVMKESRPKPLPVDSPPVKSAKKKSVGHTISSSG